MSDWCHLVSTSTQWSDKYVPAIVASKIKSTQMSLLTHERKDDSTANLWKGTALLTQKEAGQHC